MIAAKKTALAFVRVFVSFVIVVVCCLRRDALLCPRLARPVVIDRHSVEGAAGLDADYSLRHRISHGVGSASVRYSG